MIRQHTWSALGTSTGLPHHDCMADMLFKLLRVTLLTLFSVFVFIAHRGMWRDSLKLTEHTHDGLYEMDCQSKCNSCCYNSPDVCSFAIKHPSFSSPSIRRGADCVLYSVCTSCCIIAWLGFKRCFTLESTQANINMILCLSLLDTHLASTTCV